MDKNAAVILVCVLLAGGCATHKADQAVVEAAAAPQSEPAKEKSNAVAVLKGAGKGALTGAGMCALPALYSGYMGPGGLMVGGAISLVCLPFGVAIGTVAGAASAAVKSGPIL